jgi:hypothetical protein
MDIEAEKLSIEKDNLAIEKDKLALERIKLENEDRRSKRTAFWTAVSVVVPIFLGLMTIAYGFWSAKQQAQLQFRLEIAKAVMSAPTPTEVADRAEMFQKMFPVEFSGVPLDNDRGDAFVTGRQKDFFQALSAQGMTPQKKLDLWIAVFPLDDWATRPEIKAATIP